MPVRSIRRCAAQPAPGQPGHRGAEPGPEGDVTRLLIAEQPEHITGLGLAQTGVGDRRRPYPGADASYTGSRAMTIAAHRKSRATPSPNASSGCHETSC
jgi:hypothetical protein